MKPLTFDNFKTAQMKLAETEMFPFGDTMKIPCLSKMGK